MKETEITGKAWKERVEWQREIENQGDIRGLRLPDVPPVQDFPS